MDAAFLWNLSKLGKIGSRRVFFDDDVVDRLNYQYTSVLLFLFIGLIGIRQYVGKPIQCWIPQEFTRGWEEYAENYCWVSNTYFAPVHNRLPPVPDRRELQLVYYQWAPIVMAAQALLFYLPCLTWRLGMMQSGFNVQRILQMSADTNEVVPETINKTVTILAHYIRRCILRQIKHRTESEASRAEKRTKKQPHHLPPPYPTDTVAQGNNSDGTRIGKQSPCLVSFGTPMTTTLCNPTESVTDSQPLRGKKQAPPPPLSRKKRLEATANQRWLKGRESISPEFGVYTPTPGKPQGWSCGLNCGIGRKWGNYLSTLYLSVKLCYLFNVIGQLYLMRTFIGAKYVMYGASVLQDLIRGKEWHQSGHFPRVTFCDLEAKKLGKNHIYTLQCVLPLNMFLEKIYIFLWFWLVALGVVTAVSFLCWLYRIHSLASKTVYVQACLKWHEENQLDVLNQSKRVRHFVQFYLGHDGVFLLRLISANCGGILAGEVLGNLWQSYLHPEVSQALSRSTSLPDQSEHHLHRPVSAACCTCEPFVDSGQGEGQQRSCGHHARCVAHTCQCVGQSKMPRVQLNGRYVSANGMSAFASKKIPALHSNESFGDIV